MRTRNGFTFIELCIVIVIIGILAAIGFPNYISMQERAKESKVTTIAHTLQLAAEDYAVRHDGIYSDAEADILPLLPGQSRLINAFTGALTEPQFGAVAAHPGQIGLVGLDQDGRTVGYKLNAWGLDGEILLFNSGG